MVEERRIFPRLLDEVDVFLRRAARWRAPPIPLPLDHGNACVSTGGRRRRGRARRGRVPHLAQPRAAATDRRRGTTQRQCQAAQGTRHSGWLQP